MTEIFTLSEGQKVFANSDPEGRLKYFLNSLQHSDCPIEHKSGKLQFKDEEQYKNAIYIFNGDLYDDGEYDNLLGNLLNDFKTKYPDRVVDNQGNRDPNELRFGTELATVESMASCFLNKHTPSWGNVNENNYFRTYLLDFLKGKISDESLQQITALNKDNSEDFQKLVKIFNTLDASLVNGAKNSLDAVRVIYTKWMIDKTMGSGNRGVIPSKFESRRRELLRERFLAAKVADMNQVFFVKLCKNVGFIQEKSTVQENSTVQEIYKKIISGDLAQLADPGVMACLRFISDNKDKLKGTVFERFYVSDADVMQNFKSSCERGGHVYERYEKGNFNIATLADDTLFVHGTINPSSMKVGGEDYTERSIEDWITAINKAGRESVAKQLDDINNPSHADQMLPSIIKYAIQQFAIENGEIEKGRNTILSNGAYDENQKEIIKKRLKEDGHGSTIGNFLGQLDNDFLEKLVAKGVKHIVCGHKPFANSSIPPRFDIQLKNGTKIEIVMMDVTYAKDQNQATASVVLTKQEEGNVLTSEAWSQNYGHVKVCEGGNFYSAKGSNLGRDGGCQLNLEVFDDSEQKWVKTTTVLDNTKYAFEVNKAPNPNDLLTKARQLKQFSPSPERIKFPKPPSDKELQEEIKRRKSKPS